MNRLLLILILTFSFQNLTKADDISDFEIEGMSIGDSLQIYLDNKKIKNYDIADYFKSDKITSYKTTLSNFKDFKRVDISFYTKDKKKKILAISGLIVLNYNDCIKMKKKISSSVKEVLTGEEYQLRERTEKHAIDKTGKSKTYTDYFYLGPYKKNQYQDLIAVQCLDFSEELTYTDGLKLYVVKGEYVDWLENEAYK